MAGWPSGAPTAVFISTPIRRIGSDCCASTAKGQAAADPATIVMKSRRLIASPPRLRTNHRTAVTYPLEGVAGDAECPLWVISGHFALQSSCPLYPRKRTCAVQLGMSAMGQKRTSRMPSLAASMIRRGSLSLSPSKASQRAKRGGSCPRRQRPCLGQA